MSEYSKLTVILLFVIMFTVVGWASPVLYATYAPEDQFIESGGFTAQNTSTDAQAHNICFNRTIKQSVTGEIFTELFIVGDDMERKKVSTDSIQRYFRGGQRVVVTPLSLPPNLEPGTYQYVLVVQMELAEGRVIRDFVYYSEPFSVHGENQSFDQHTVGC